MTQQEGRRGHGWAAEAPSWLAAYSHAWLNRDNGGCSPSPASFLQAQPQVPESPEPPLENRPGWEEARKQYKGLSQGRGARSWKLLGGGEGREGS